MIKRYAEERDQYIGRKFGRLVITGWKYVDKKGYVFICNCDCGSISEILRSRLINYGVQSCGCLQREILTRRNTIHGLTDTYEARILSGMKTRIRNKNNKGYKNYGGRGLTICERWLEKGGLTNFIADMGNAPDKSFSIERLDNNIGYSPDNCCWANVPVQSRHNRRIKLNQSIAREIRDNFSNGMTRSEIARKYNISWEMSDAIVHNKSWREEAEEIRVRQGRLLIENTNGEWVMGEAYEPLIHSRL